MKFITWLLLVVLIGIGVWIYALGHRVRPVAAVPAVDPGVQLQQAEGKAKQDILAQLTALGQVLKNVSLQSPTASADIEQQYAPFVTRSLRAAWKARVDTVLGRMTSSPWPDHISVTSIEAVPDGTYAVRATVVFMTSAEVKNGGDAGRDTLQLTMKYEDGAWKVDSVSMLKHDQPNAPIGVQDKPQLE